MRVKIGEVLIAKKTVHMQYNPIDVCLTKHHKYKIKGFSEDCFIIDSDILKDHYWGMEDLDNFFIKSNKILNKNIIIL